MTLPTKSSTDFGAMTTNLAAAIGIKTAIQTVNKATQTLDQQCTLQAEMAEEMGGIGKDSGKGLISLELTTQVNAAVESGQAIRDDAFGALAAGFVGAAGALVSTVGAAKVGADESLTSDLEDGESFKNELTTRSATEEDATPATDDDAIKATIEKWRGSRMKDPDFSNFKKESDQLTGEEKAELAINRKALQRVREGDPKVKAEINRNIENHIGGLKQRIANKTDQKRSNLINISYQTVQTGTNSAQAAGHLAQASDTINSQTNQALGSVLEKVVQNTTQQASSAAQSANTDQSEIANVLQNIAFPA